MPAQFQTGGTTLPDHDKIARPARCRRWTGGLAGKEPEKS